MEREAFVNIVTADRLDAPGYFAYDSVLNSKKRQILDPNLSNTLRVGVPSLGRRQYHRGDGGDRIGVALEERRIGLFIEHVHPAGPPLHEPMHTT